MALYNITNLSATNVYQVAFEINRIEPMFGYALIILPFFIMLLAMLASNINFKTAIVASGFVCSLAGLLLRATGLVQDAAIVVLLLITAAGAGLMFIKN